MREPRAYNQSIYLMVGMPYFLLGAFSLGILLYGMSIMYGLSGTTALRVMAPMFSGRGEQPPFTADCRNRDNGLIYQMNPGKAPGAAQSAKMNFSRPDDVNTALLNRILWRDIKGNVPMPAPRHTIFPAKTRDDDDD